MVIVPTEFPMLEALASIEIDILAIPADGIVEETLAKVEADAFDEDVEVVQVVVQEVASSGINVPVDEVTIPRDKDSIAAEEPVPAVEPVLVEEHITFEESASVEECAPFEEFVSVAEELIAVEESVPVENPSFIEGPISVEEPTFIEPGSAKEASPAEELALIEESTPVEESAPAEESSLIEEPTPVEEYTPAEELASTEDLAPVEEPIPVDEIAQVVETSEPEAHVEESNTKEQAIELTTEEEVQSLGVESFDSALPENPGIVTQKFLWKHGGHHIKVTGMFDNWQGTMVLSWDGEVFSGTVDLDRTRANQFKFIVDGSWICSPDYATEYDGN
ncbi:hypothetical protein BGZ65_010066, partial [Modicella reniformis]